MNYFVNPKAKSQRNNFRTEIPQIKLNGSRIFSDSPQTLNGSDQVKNSDFLALMVQCFPVNCSPWPHLVSLLLLVLVLPFKSNFSKAPFTLPSFQRSR